MGRRRSEEADQGGKWLTTFNDLVTLLLTFFVLTLSLSKLDTAKVKEMSRSVNSAMGRLEEGTKVGIQVFEPFVHPIRHYGLPLEKKKKVLAKKIAEQGTMDAEVLEKGVRVTMDEKVLFATGEAEIQSRFFDDLRVLCLEFREVEGEICVEGHTDDVPINTARFPSNWELSSARAASVVRFMVEQGIAPERLSVAGYGDFRPRREGGERADRAANRRVEIVVKVKE